MWDLVDYHLLPAAVAACAAEADDGGPRLGCALVKLGLIALGALGLYCTRSLYGERSKGAAQAALDSGSGYRPAHRPSGTAGCPWHTRLRGAQRSRGWPNSTCKGRSGYCRAF